jgi:hypothetical protein
MTTTGVVEEATLRPEVPLERPALHADRRLEDAILRMSFVREARSDRTASRAISNASSRLSA